MSWGTHKTIRNCKGEYPESTYALRGYELGPLKIRQCPKTFITKEAKAHLDYYDTIQEFGLKPSDSIDNLPADFVDLSKTIEIERAQARRERNRILAERHQRGK